MAACSKYRFRLEKALAYRGLKYPKEIIDYMGKRATSDRSLDGIILAVCEIIEPPYCQKTHCHLHTTFAFCGCSESRVPGKCPLNLEYLKRKKEREEKLLNSRLEQIPQKYLPITQDSIERIKNMRPEEWEKQLKKLKRNAKKEETTTDKPDK